MAYSRGEVQVTWETNQNSYQLPGEEVRTSNAMTFTTGAVGGELEIQANNTTTPAAGDYVDFRILYTCGDPGGAGADVYDTPGHGQILGRCDTFVEDSAIQTVKIPVAAKGFKIYVESGSSANDIVVSAALYELRA